MVSSIFLASVPFHHDPPYLSAASSIFSFSPLVMDTKRHENEHPVYEP
jgi:hypothetical protein